MWALPDIQNNNKRTSHHVTAFDETKTLTQWSHEAGISRMTIRDRLARGVSPESAMTVPSYRGRMVAVQGKKRTVAEWSRATGLRRYLIAQQLRKGWSPERALTSPVDLKFSRLASRRYAA